MSDSSLSYTQSATSYPAFYFDFYEDQKFSQIYETSGVDASFDVSRTGTIGVTADAKVTLKINENTPKNLYYKLSPVDTSDNLTENKEINVDENVLNNNIIKNSVYSGRFNIISTGSTTFIWWKWSESDSYTTFAKVDIPPSTKQFNWWNNHYWVWWWYQIIPEYCNYITR